MTDVLPALASFQRAALNLFFPPWCIGCGREGNYICVACHQSLTYISPPICPVCGRPLTDAGTCPGCIEPPLAIDGIRAPFLFSGVIRKAVHDLKYHNLKDIGPVLAGYLYDYLLSNPVPADVIVPVPIHRKRRRERGYNQSALIAHELSIRTGIPMAPNCLIRKTYTPPQVRTATAVERRANVTHAFTCIDNSLNNKHVLIIDDVSTSGATLNACAAALKAAGVAGVHGLTIALEN
jgi:ComF family protein